MTSEILVCPDCGTPRFSWIVEQVQFGHVHQFENNAGPPHRDAEGMKMGEVVDTDIEENGVWCQECDGFVELDDLVTEAEYEELN